MQVACFVSLVTIVLLMMKRANGRMPDDAFIFYRYARNIVRSDGWTYNVGVSTGNAATSPLWTAVLTVGYFVHRDMIAVGAFLYALCLAGAGHLTALTLRRMGRPVAAVAAALLIVVNPAELWVRGMESAIFLLLVAAFLHLALGKVRAPWDGIVGGLLILVRPEGAILIAIVLAHRWRSTRKVPWRSSVAALCVLVPWLLFSTYVFGSPVSETLAAKTAQGRSGFFGPPFVFARYLHSMIVRPWSAALIVASGVGGVFAIRRRELQEYAAVVVGFVAVHFAAYALIVRPPAYLWYYAAEYYGLAVFAALGVDLATEWVTSRRADDTVGERSTAGRLAGGLSIALVMVLVALSVRAQERDDIYSGYRAGAIWLRDHAGARQSVSATEIGVIGWTSNRPIVDYLGLLSDQSAAELGRGDLASWLEREHPDFYVAHLPLWDMEAPSAQLPIFSTQYQPVYETDGGGWSHLRIFQRLSVPSPTALLTATVDSAFRAAGADLDDTERRAVSSLLAVYVGSPTMQKTKKDGGYETPDGVDFSGLLAWSSSGDSKLGSADRMALSAVVERLSGHTVVSPLAPRGSV